MNEVAKERTGWRDQEISARHRKWGYDCPALDIDFLMLEYDRGKAVALAEFKNEHAAQIRMGHPSIQALINLADAANIPLFLVRYATNFSWHHVTPGNSNAKCFVPEAIKLTEPEWIALLYRCRGREVPTELLSTIV